jgi:hypothetical protein
MHEYDSKLDVTFDSLIPSSLDVGMESGYQLGPWTDTENDQFEEALKLYGKDWHKVQLFIGTRSRD